MTEATAFAPGHVTAIFAPYPDREPIRAGSRGAGVALASGVEVAVRPGTAGEEHREADLLLNGEPTRMEAVGRVLADLDAVDVTTVEATTELPLGAGFGVSGACALATALAVNSALGLRESENALIRTAHTAEVVAGTGLGDVVGAFRGGLPIRVDPGGPTDGRMDGVPGRPRVEYVSFGELATEQVLDGPLEAVRDAGEAALKRLLRRPNQDELLAAANEFAAEADLLVPEVAEAIEAVESEGGSAAMAMLGRTVFAFGTGLSDAGYDPEVCSVHPPGAGLRSPETA